MGTGDTPAGQPYPWATSTRRASFLGAQSLLDSWVAGKHLGGSQPILQTLSQSAGESLFLPALFLFPNLLPLVSDIFPQVLGILVSELGFLLSLLQPHAPSRWGSVSPPSIGFYV